MKIYFPPLKTHHPLLSPSVTSVTHTPHTIIHLPLSVTGDGFIILILCSVLLRRPLLYPAGHGTEVKIFFLVLFAFVKKQHYLCTLFNLSVNLHSLMDRYILD